MTPCCANSHNSMPLRVLTVRTSLHTYISYAHKYTYIKNHITDMLVYRPVLCTLTLVCALANAPTLNLFVYMHMLTSICIIMYIYIYIYMSNRKNPGNTKYVFDGLWFMEIDGNC